MRRMSRYFTWVPNWFVKRIQYITSIGLNYKNRGFYLESVWLLGISGSYSQEMMGLVLVVVPKQDLKLPVRSSETSETAVPLEGPIGMLIVSGCRIVS